MILQPYDVEVGAGTLHPATVLRALGPKPWRAAYVQPSRRPADGRYGENPNRLHQHHQYQVILKPNPAEPAGALPGLAGGDRHRPRAARHPLRRGRLGEPDGRRLGPGLGGLVRRDGDHPVHLLPAGRRARRLPGGRRADLSAWSGWRSTCRASIASTTWPSTTEARLQTYGDVFLENERQQFSALNCEVADVDVLKRQFEDMEREVPRLLAAKGRRASRWCCRPTTTC